MMKENICLTIVRAVTFVLTAVAALFAVLATSGDYWTVKNVLRAGLWKRCSPLGCYKVTNDSGMYNICILTRFIFIF